MRVLLFLLRSSGGVRHSRLILLSVAATSLFGGVGSTLFLAAVNSALHHGSAAPASLIWGFVGVCLVLAFSRIISQVLLLRFSTAVLYALRMRMCRRLLSLPLRRLEEAGPNRLLVTLSDDVGSISDALNIMPILITQLAILACSALYLLWLSWAVFLIIISFVVVGVAAYHMSVKKAVDFTGLARGEWDKLFKYFRGLIEGNKELKLHRERREDFFQRGLLDTSAALQGHQVKAGTVYIYANYWSQMVIFVVIGLLLFAVPRLNNIDMPVLTGYTLVFLYILGPLQSVLQTLPNLTRAGVAAGRVSELGLTLELQPGDADPAAGNGHCTSWNKLELKGVTHAYRREREESNFTLGPIDLTIYANELIFITGGNGSGKTTLVKLLTGLYIPEAGEIRLDGRPITDEERDHYRQRFSVVFADYYLFDSFFGLDEPELDTRAHALLVQLQLDHKVRVENGTPSTTALSQGQRKRLALLTAYLEDRPVYVFDEWAADQDPQFKDVFYCQLLPELKSRGKTVIVISHDDRYYYLADRVIKLDYGKVTSDGLGRGVRVETSCRA
jgi:putative ATP-binding cassette transporter